MPRLINVTTDRDEIRRLRARVANLEEALGWLAYRSGETVHMGRPMTKLYVKPETLDLCREILQEG